MSPVWSRCQCKINISFTSFYPLPLLPNVTKQCYLCGLSFEHLTNRSDWSYALSTASDSCRQTLAANSPCFWNCFPWNLRNIFNTSLLILIHCTHDLRSQTRFMRSWFSGQCRNRYVICCWASETSRFHGSLLPGHNSLVIVRIPNLVVKILFFLNKWCIPACSLASGSCQ